MIIKKDNQFSVECHSKVASDCLQNGDYCETEEEAQEWVEDECWINSGEGWICPQCNIHFMGNLSTYRRDKKLDRIDTDMAGGVETIQRPKI